MQRAYLGFVNENTKPKAKPIVIVWSFKPTFRIFSKGLDSEGRLKEFCLCKK